MPKTNVVSFRLDPAKYSALRETLLTDKPLGVRSVSQLARKIVHDALAGRLVYGNNEDRFIDAESPDYVPIQETTETVPAEQAPPPVETLPNGDSTEASGEVSPDETDSR